MTVCRACLYEGENLTDLDETFINNYNTLTGLKIALRDGLSQVKCATCKETVRAYVVFREKCQVAENTLQKKLILETLDTKDFAVDRKGNVKIELLDEDINIKEELSLPSNDISNTFGNDTYYFCGDDNLMDCDDIAIEDEKPIRKSVRKRSKPKKFTPSASAREQRDTKQQSASQTIKLELHCGLCTSVFTSRDKLNEHLQVVHMDSKMCDICLITFLNCSTMCRHRHVHIPKDQHHCHLCLKDVMHMEYHYRHMHFKETCKFQCPVCGIVFKTKKQLKYHHKVHKTAGEKFTCELCGKSYNKKSELASHIRRHDNREYKCKSCDAVYKNDQGLRIHVLRLHTPTAIRCTKCKVFYRTQKLYDRHACHGKRVCIHCGVLVQAKHYNLHVKKHRTKAMYKCELCSHTLMTREAFRVHMDRHKGTPRFTCEFCQRKFYGATVLIKHRRTHTGEKPYVCSICSKGFTGNHNLKVHMKVHGLDLVVKKNTNPEETKSIFTYDADK